MKISTFTEIEGLTCHSTYEDLGGKIQVQTYCENNTGGDLNLTIEVYGANDTFITDITDQTLLDGYNDTYLIGIGDSIPDHVVVKDGSSPGPTPEPFYQGNITFQEGGTYENVGEKGFTVELGYVTEVVAGEPELPITITNSGTGNLDMSSIDITAYDDNDTDWTGASATDTTLIENGTITLNMSFMGVDKTIISRLYIEIYGERVTPPGPTPTPSTLEEVFTSTANSIRAKLGTQAGIAPTEFYQKIMDISGGGAITMQDVYNFEESYMSSIQLTLPEGITIGPDYEGNNFVEADIKTNRQSLSSQEIVTNSNSMLVRICFYNSSNIDYIVSYKNNSQFIEANQSAIVDFNDTLTDFDPSLITFTNASEAVVAKYKLNYTFPNNSTFDGMTTIVYIDKLQAGSSYIFQYKIDVAELNNLNWNISDGTPLYFGALNESNYFDNFDNTYIESQDQYYHVYTRSGVTNQSIALLCYITTGNLFSASLSDYLNGTITLTQWSDLTESYSISVPIPFSKITIDETNCSSYGISFSDVLLDRTSKRVSMNIMNSTGSGETNISFGLADSTYNYENVSSFISWDSWSSHEFYYDGYTIDDTDANFKVTANNNNAAESRVPDSGDTISVVDLDTGDPVSSTDIQVSDIYLYSNGRVQLTISDGTNNPGYKYVTYGVELSVNGSSYNLIEGQTQSTFYREGYTFDIDNSWTLSEDLYNNPVSLTVKVRIIEMTQASSSIITEASNPATSTTVYIPTVATDYGITHIETSFTSSDPDDIQMRPIYYSISDGVSSTSGITWLTPNMTGFVNISSDVDDSSLTSVVLEWPPAAKTIDAELDTSITANTDKWTLSGNTATLENFSCQLTLANSYFPQDISYYSLRFDLDFYDTNDNLVLAKHGQNRSIMRMDPSEGHDGWEEYPIVYVSIADEISTVAAYNSITKVVVSNFYAIEGYIDTSVISNFNTNFDLNLTTYVAATKLYTNSTPSDPTMTLHDLIIVRYNSATPGVYYQILDSNDDPISNYYDIGNEFATTDLYIPASITGTKTINMYILGQVLFNGPLLSVTDNNASLIEEPLSGYIVITQNQGITSMNVTVKNNTQDTIRVTSAYYKTKDGIEILAPFDKSEFAPDESYSINGSINQILVGLLLNTEIVSE